MTAGEYLYSWADAERDRGHGGVEAVGRPGLRLRWSRGPERCDPHRIRPSGLFASTMIAQTGLLEHPRGKDRPMVAPNPPQVADPEAVKRHPNLFRAIRRGRTEKRGCPGIGVEDQPGFLGAAFEGHQNVAGSVGSWPRGGGRSRCCGPQVHLGRSPPSRWHDFPAKRRGGGATTGRTSAPWGPKGPCETDDSPVDGAAVPRGPG